MQLSDEMREQVDLKLILATVFKTILSQFSPLFRSLRIVIYFGKPRYSVTANTHLKFISFILSKTEKY